MQKNIVIACGIGDIFTFLTRVDDFFDKNPEYTSIRFWAWNHSPELAKELVELSDHSISIFSVEDMVNYLKDTMPPEFLPQAEKFFIKQNRGGSGVDKYMEFINRFFPNLEQWVWIGVYNKYATRYPYCLETPKPDRERDYIVVHPVSHTVKTEKPERTWSTTRWGRILKMMSSYCLNEDIILIGTRYDKIEGSNEFPSKGIIDTRGKLTLTETISLVNNAKAFVGINSWPALMALWNTTPTYVQWFVQHQFLDTHLPQPKDKLPNAIFELGEKGHPKTDEAWANIVKVLDATVTI